MQENKKLEIVLRSSFIHEIHIAKAKLESESIKSYLIDENINSTIGTSFVEGYKLFVDSSDLDRAHTILSIKIV